MSQPRNPLFVSDGTPITAAKCYVQPFTVRYPNLVLPVVAIEPSWRVAGADKDGVVPDLVSDRLKTQGFVTMQTWIDGVQAKATSYVARLGSQTGEIWDPKSGTVLGSGFGTTESEWRDSIPRIVLDDTTGWVLVLWASGTKLDDPDVIGEELDRAMKGGRILGAMVPVTWSPLPHPQ